MHSFPIEKKRLREIPNQDFFKIIVYVTMAVEQLFP